jgi:predicted alpha/beta superfamily hydrolase
MLSLLLTATLSVAQVRTHSLAGDVRHHDAFETKAIPGHRNLIVYLPPGYVTSKARYPVLYMNDGQNVMDGMTSFIPNQEWQADENAERLILAKEIQPIIIVGIDNGGAERGNEYLPTRAKFGGQEMGGKADLYGKMLTDEIMPFIDKSYRTKTGPSSTTLLGSSFGGVISLYLGLKHPDVFGSVGVVSPSLWWDDRVMNRMADGLKGKLPLRIWLDMGTKEGYQGLVDARNLKRELIEKGWTLGKDLGYMEATGASHNETAWAARMEPILKFFYGR